MNFNFTGNIAIIGNETDPQLPWLSQISLLDLTNKLNMEKTSINAFTNTMLGFELAEDGNSLIAYSYYEFDNCKLINFSLPESDQNDVAFTIERPVATIAQIQMDSVIMATDNQFIFEAVICNTGLVPAIFDKYYFKNNLHFKLLDDSMPDTVDIGKCKNIRILASPVDTGDLKDELIFVACGYELSVPLSIYSKNRNLQALNPSPVDLG